MRFFLLVFTALFGLVSQVSASDESKCLSCTPVTVELTTAAAMLDFVIYAQDADAERRRVLDTLLGWVYGNKEYELGLRLASRIYGWSGGQELEVNRMLGDEGPARLRGFLATSDSPSQLARAMRSFREKEAYTLNEREPMCAKIITGTDLEALDGFEAGCRFGHYADALRARVLKTTDAQVARAVLESDFGRVFLMPEEKRSLFKYRRN